MEIRLYHSPAENPPKSTHPTEIKSPRGWAPGLSPSLGDYEECCCERGWVPASMGDEAIMEESLSIKQGHLCELGKRVL